MSSSLYDNKLHVSQENDPFLLHDFSNEFAHIWFEYDTARQLIVDWSAVEIGAKRKAQPLKCPMSTVKSVCSQHG